MARRPLPHPQQRQRTDRPKPGAGPNGGRQRHRRPPSTDHGHPWTASAGSRRRTQVGRHPKDRRGPLLFLVASVILVVALVPYGPLLAAISLMAAAAWSGPSAGLVGAHGPRRGADPTTPVVVRRPRPVLLRGRGSGPPVRPRRRLGEGLPHARLRRRRARPGCSSATRRTSRTARRSPGPGSSSFCTPSRAAVASTTSTGTRRATSSPSRSSRRFPPTSPPSDSSPHPARRSSASPTRPTSSAPSPHLRGGTARRPPGRLAHRHPLHRAAPADRRPSRQRHDHTRALHRAPGPSVRRCRHRRGRWHRRVRVPDRPGRRPRRRVRPRRGARESGVGRERDGTAADLRQPCAAGGAPRPRRHQEPPWILLDRPSALGHFAAADGRNDPQALLQVPLRHGRAAGVTVVIAEQFEDLEALSEAVQQHTRARVVLGSGLSGPAGSRPRRAAAHHSYVGGAAWLR